MTDRTRRITVILDKSYREDDVEKILSAIRLTKGVSAAQIEVDTSSDYLARMTARADLMADMIQAVVKVFDNE